MRLYRCHRCGRGIDATQHGKYRCDQCGGRKWAPTNVIHWRESKQVWRECGVWVYMPNEWFWRKWYADMMTWYAKKRKIGWMNKRCATTGQEQGTKQGE